MKLLLVLFLSGASIVCACVGYKRDSDLLMRAGRGLSYASSGAAIMMAIDIIERLLSV